jgi:hypothetical protein
MLMYQLHVSVASILCIDLQLSELLYHIVYSACQRYMSQHCAVYCDHMITCILLVP